MIFGIAFASHLTGSETSYLCNWLAVVILEQAVGGGSEEWNDGLWRHSFRYYKVLQRLMTFLNEIIQSLSRPSCQQDLKERIKSTCVQSFSHSSKSDNRTGQKELKTHVYTMWWGSVSMRLPVAVHGHAKESDGIATKHFSSYGQRYGVCLKCGRHMDRSPFASVASYQWLNSSCPISHHTTQAVWVWADI